MEANEMPRPEPAESLQEKDKKALKKEKKELKDLMGMERTSLALDRTLLAMVRTGTTFMTFGFAIYKLMQERAKQPGDHPIVQIFTPKSVALVLFITGFVGLLFQLINVAQTRKRLGLNEHGFWKTPVALLSYVILAMLALLITGVIIGRD
jgi:putative membrane protein